LIILQVREEASDLVAYHAGIGMGIVTALRGARIRLARGECTIPKELIPAKFPYHKFNTEDPKSELTEEEKELLKGAVREMVSVASSHLAEARDRQSVVPKHARPCFLPVVPALHFLSKLEKVDYDIFDDSLLEPDQLRVLLLLGRTWLTGVF
jgi:NADH dehydrogenase [ubiquinone] 1 alpha subcomplex assembly factor 6